jgi:hypothetical protein
MTKTPTKKRKATAYYPIRASAHPKPAPLIATWDVETAGLGGRVLLASWAVEGAGDTIAECGLIDGAPDEIMRGMVARMLDTPGVVWYAHFAGYDMRYLIPTASADGAAFGAILNGMHQVLQLVITFPGREPITLRDSYALLPVSLRRLADQFAPGERKLDIGDAVSDFDPSDPDQRAYALQDARALLAVLMRHRAICRDEYGVEPAVSAAGTAIKALRATLTDKIPCALGEVRDVGRLGYIGGYVAPLRAGGHRDCVTYDINSAYPAAMRDGPIPLRPRLVRVVDTTAAAYPDALYLVDVHAPKSIPVPVLGRRDKTGAVCWPLGTWRGWHYGCEIAMARSIGYEIDLVVGQKNALIDFEPAHVFGDFVDKCEKIRVANRKTAFEMVAKLMQNSAYGKFGARDETYSLVLENSSPAENELSRTPLAGVPGYVVATIRDPETLAAPHIAGLITARARVNLFSAIYSRGADNARKVLYCDTDSMTVLSDFDTSGMNLSDSTYGAFKREKSWRLYRVIAPKVYAGQLESGDWAGACKGVPDPDFEALYRDGRIDGEYQSLPTLYTVLKSGIVSPATSKTRQSSNPSRASGWGWDGAEFTPAILQG